MAVLLKIIPFPQRKKRIVTAGLFILIQILIGIHDIDELSEEKSHPSQRRLPGVLIDRKKLRHYIAKISADFINIRISRRLRGMELVQPVLNDGSLAAIVHRGSLSASLQELCQRKLVNLALVIPVVHTGIIGQDQIHVGRIIRDLIDSCRMFFKRMRDAFCLGNLILLIIKIREEHDEKRHVITEGKLTDHAVFFL